MKRIVLLMLLAILTSGIATAQNANRHGFFLELGAGGLIGSTPRTSVSVQNNVMYGKCLSGAAADFGLGGRIRIGNHWAYELKAEAQIPFANPIASLVGRGLPIGFRYTSVEVYRNFSLYAHFNLGGAIIVNRGLLYTNDVLMPNSGEIKLKYSSGSEGYGVAYSFGVGVNITTHAYVEACMNAQMMFDGYRSRGNQLLNYGIAACVVGYRF